MTTSTSRGTERPHQRATNQDAREFGLHMKQGGWRLGLLVARNVVRSPGRVSVESLAPKTNATRFAQVAQTSNDRVLRHLNAWEAAADAGLVPHAAELSPGTDIELDAEALPAWTTFYHPQVSRTSRRPAAPVTTTTGMNDTQRAVAAADNEDAVRRVLAEANAAAATGLPGGTADQETRAAAQAAAAAAVAQRRAAREAAERQSAAAVEEAVNAAGRRYQQAAEQMPYDPENPAAAPAVHAELAAEVRELIGKQQWFTRRLFDIARDTEWQEGGRAQAAEDIRALAQQLNLVADLAADPDSGRVTDAAAARLLDPKA